MITITLNGDDREIPGDLTLAALLEQLEVNRQQVAVEVNSELVPREQHRDCQIRAGDRLEIVTLVGGG